jgi:hypothetical protein
MSAVLEEMRAASCATLSATAGYGTCTGISALSEVGEWQPSRIWSFQCGLHRFVTEQH